MFFLSLTPFFPCATPHSPHISHGFFCLRWISSSSFSLSPTPSSHVPRPILPVSHRHFPPPNPLKEPPPHSRRRQRTPRSSPSRSPSRAARRSLVTKSHRCAFFSHSTPFFPCVTPHFPNPHRHFFSARVPFFFFARPLFLFVTPHSSHISPACVFSKSPRATSDRVSLPSGPSPGRRRRGRTARPPRFSHYPILPICHPPCFLYITVIF